MQQKPTPVEVLRGSGKKPGLEIWVLRTVRPQRRSFPALLVSQQPKPEPEYELFTVSPIKHGVFYNEDLYIILHTKPDCKQRNIHFWFGRAYKDNPPLWIDRFKDLELDWKATQHIEFQGLECELFESYFQGTQPAIRYKRGRQPEPYAERVRGETRFYKLERLDKAQYRVREIPFNIALMTKEECFILDTDYNTRTYVSDRTTVDERNKSIIVANRIRELDHEGNGDIEVVNLTTFSNNEDREAYVKAALLEEQAEPPPQVDYDLPDEDPASPQVKMNMLTLLSSEDADIGYPPRFRYIPKPKKTVKEEKKGFLIRVRKGVLRFLGYETKKEIEYEIPALDEKFVKKPVEKPFKREELKSKTCFLLVGTPGQGVFMWVGSACDPQCEAELTECMRLEIRRCEPSQCFNNDFDPDETDTDAYTKKDDKTKDKPTPEWTHVIKITEGNEPLKFKRYFQDWE